MCKSKDAVIASYLWAVLHTPVDTRAMYNMLAHYCHCLYLVLFATGEGRGKTAKRKTAKAIVSVFSSGSQGSHVWLAWLAWLAGSHIGHTHSKHPRREAGLSFTPRLRIFRDTLILVFMNENCCLCKCFTGLYFFF